LVEFNKTNSPNDLVNAIFDCRALYSPPSSLYGNPFDMVNNLKRDICDWVFKLQQTQEGKIRAKPKIPTFIKNDSIEQ
jgi:hypothetical protein